MPKSFLWILVAGLSGFLFGFDTVVISGANLPTKELWSTSPFFHGFFIMSIALWGTVFGALFGAYPTNQLGRKKTLTWVGILFLISALGSALAIHPYIFSFFRFIGGLAVGVSSITAPIYISEISSPKNRGSLGALYQFSLVFGIMIAFLSNYLFTGFSGSHDWRWMLGIESVPALFYLIFTLNIPDTPRWQILFQKNDNAALKTLKLIYGENHDLEKLVDDIKSADSPLQKQKYLIRKTKFRTIMLAFLISFFNQLSGINFILYYAPEILEIAGFATQASLFNSVLIGMTNIIFTFTGLMLIDRLGRRQLLIIGSLGYIISLSAVSFAFYHQLSPEWIAVFIFAFIASHAVGQGTVIWVFISEIFPNRVRAEGQSFGAGVHWVFAALITLVGPPIIAMYETNPWPIFSFFAFMMFLQLIFSVFLMPETKGKSLEEINQLINN